MFIGFDSDTPRNLIMTINLNRCDRIMVSGASLMFIPSDEEDRMHYEFRFKDYREALQALKEINLNLERKSNFFSINGFLKRQLAKENNET